MYHNHMKTCLQNCSFSIKDIINEHENNPDFTKDSNENRVQAICEEIDAWFCLIEIEHNYLSYLPRILKFF